MMPDASASLRKPVPAARSCGPPETTGFRQVRQSLFKLKRTWCPNMSPTYRFIIADDDHELRFFVRRILLQHYPDASIDEAADGEEALQLYDSNGADLMVVDYKIPALNGTELIRKLRERSATIPIVMASN